MQLIMKFAWAHVAVNASETVILIAMELHLSGAVRQIIWLANQNTFF